MKRTGIIQHLWKACALVCGIILAIQPWTPESSEDIDEQDA
jgi:hypothetical protein